LPQRPQYGSKIPPSFAGQKTGDVFEKNPAGMQLADDSGEFPKESASASSQSSTASSHREVLTGPPGRDDIDPESSAGNSGNIENGFFMGKVPPTHAITPGVVFRGPNRADTTTPKSQVKAPDPSKQTTGVQAHQFIAPHT